MDENLRKQIYENLGLKETEDLQEILQERDTGSWNEVVFEIIEEILLERLGTIPPPSSEVQAAQFLRNIEQRLEQDEFENALSECELAIQLNPDLADAYNYRGVIYDALNQRNEAITNYRKAIQLNPKLREAWDNLFSLERVLEKEFQESVAKQHLDQALEYANDDEFDKALEEIETVKSTIPGIGIAHNYLGLIFLTLNQLEPAIDSFLKALDLNPRYSSARENLTYAREKKEEEQYHQIVKLGQDDMPETNLEFDKFDIPDCGDDELVLQWLYMDEEAYLLVGWAGYRNRQGRSGIDPLDTYFEFAHMQGVFSHSLMIGKYRTRNPIYLFLMAFAGIIFCAPLLMLIGLVIPDLTIILNILSYIIESSPYWIIGVALWVNVISSLLPVKPEKIGDIA